MAEPAKQFPSIFSEKTFWDCHPFFLPNLFVATVFVVTSTAGWFLLAETNPRCVAGNGLDRNLPWNFRRLWKTYTRKRAQAGNTEYSAVGEDDDLSLATQLSPTGATEGERNEVELAAHENSAPSNAEGVPPHPVRRQFTNQIALQIQSVSQLALHKVASDMLIPVFLASPRPHSDDLRMPTGSFLSLNGGFGLSTASVGKVFFTQAVTAVLVQSLVVPRLISRFGPLRTYRWTLSAFPWLYCLIPFVMKLSSPLALVALLVDLWAKVLFIALGYVSSAILWVQIACELVRVMP